MAVFVRRTLDPTLNPPACTTPVFADVPASSPFCKWIEELARRRVVTGCGGGNYCPTEPVTREQMGVFIGALRPDAVRTVMLCGPGEAQPAALGLTAASRLRPRPQGVRDGVAAACVTSGSV
jgi:hypothetical protein